jgi:ubiquinol-cytochrome c reductase cytochrome b subunit
VGAIPEFPHRSGEQGAGVMRGLLEWIESRTGWVRLVGGALMAPIPGGARWRYTWGSLLAFAFFTQVVTGFFLWTHYSPSAQTAWESVWYLEYVVPGGWFLRGLHHFTAQLFVVLLVVHVVQLVLFRAYVAPRELAFWLALLLVPLAVGMSVTGWLLPFDQKGYWAARVPLNLTGLAPGVGGGMQQVMMGGGEIGHHTLTRFLALHAGLFPLLMGVILLLHLWLHFRERLRGWENAPDHAERHWPDQLLRDAFACLLATALVVTLVLMNRGAGLGAPVDASEDYGAARPEWLFLFLYQFLKLFRGSAEVWGAVIVPSMVFAFLVVMPWIGRSRFGHAVNVVVIGLLLLGATVLTGAALLEDRNDPVFRAAVRQADSDGARVRRLAELAGRIPAEGALALVRDDPLWQGPRLFARHCASCHRYDGHDGLGRVPVEAQTASELKGFANREWLAGLFDPEHVASVRYFGGTRFENGQMARFVKRDVAGFDESEREQLRRVILAVSAEAGLAAQREMDQRDEALIEEGRVLIDDETMRCTECHKFHEHDYDPVGPELTGYGSRDWLVEFIKDPAHARFYGRRNDRMPRYGVEEVLDEKRIGLIADWLRGEWPE